jgi:hypothetical protein
VVGFTGQRRVAPWDPIRPRSMDRVIGLLTATRGRPVYRRSFVFLQSVPLVQRKLNCVFFSGETISMNTHAVASQRISKHGSRAEWLFNVSALASSESFCATPDKPYSMQGRRDSIQIGFSLDHPGISSHILLPHVSGLPSWFA